MTAEQIIQEIARAAGTNPEAFSQESLLIEIPGWDSLSIVEFLAAIDEHATIPPDARDFANCTTVSELVQLASRITG